jgi:hypothetical protein
MAQLFVGHSQRSVEPLVVYLQKLFKHPLIRAVTEIIDEIQQLNQPISRSGPAQSFKSSRYFLISRMVIFGLKPAPAII